jgi:hypothetical protein
VAWLIQASNALFNGSATAWVITVYYVGLTFIIGSIIWLILYVSPNLIQTVIGTKNKTTSPSTTQEPVVTNLPLPPKDVAVKTPESLAPVQTRWVPIPQEAPVVDEESDSEKLRREFKTRRL